MNLIYIIESGLKFTLSANLAFFQISFARNIILHPFTINQYLYWLQETAESLKFSLSDDTDYLHSGGLVNSMDWQTTFFLLWKAVNTEALICSSVDKSVCGILSYKWNILLPSKIIEEKAI